MRSGETGLQKNRPIKRPRSAVGSAFTVGAAIGVGTRPVGSAGDASCSTIETSSCCSTASRSVRWWCCCELSLCGALGDDRSGDRLRLEVDVAQLPGGRVAEAEKVQPADR